MWLRQAIQGQHAKDRRQRRAQNGELERDRNKRRPTVQGASCDIQRIGIDVAPVLKEKAAQTAAQSTNQSDQRHFVTLQAHRLRETFYGKGRVGFISAVASLAGLFRGMNELMLGHELTQYAVCV